MKTFLFFIHVDKAEGWRGRACREGCIGGMSPAASCQVDDKLSYKLNTSGMKMHYPSASLALPVDAAKLKEDSLPENWKEANGRNEFRDFFVRQRFKRISSRLVRELRKNLFSRISGWSWRLHPYSIYGWIINPLYRISFITMRL